MVAKNHFHKFTDPFLNPEVKQNDLDEKKETLPRREAERKPGRKKEEEVKMNTERGNV